MMNKKTNKKWHDANKIFNNATFEQRLEWYLVHSKNCKCRPIPEKLRLKIEKRTKSRYLLS